MRPFGYGMLFTLDCWDERVFPDLETLRDNNLDRVRYEDSSSYLAL